MEQNSITMIERAFDILDYIFEQDDPVGVSQIARDLSLPKANVFRILSTLYQVGAVEKSEEDKYILGRLLVKLGHQASHNLDLIHVARPMLAKLSKDTGESVNLGIQYESSVLNLIGFEGESSTLVSRLIPIAPLYCSSMGKLFLSQMEDAELEAYFSSLKVTVSTIKTKTTLEAFLENRDEILREGIAYDLEEYEYGLGCISAPVYNRKSRICAAINISGPLSRLEYKGLQPLKLKLTETSKRLSEMIQYLDLDL